MMFWWIYFDATSLYPSAMWVGNSVNSQTETGLAFKPVVNKTSVDGITNQTFNEDGNESVILKTEYYKPPDNIFQHLPVKEKVGIFEVSRMRNGYIIDTFTSADICETVKTGAKVIEIYEGVLYRKNFRISPFKKISEKLFALRRKYKDELNDLMQGLVKLITNSLNGAQIGRDINEFYIGKPEHWMKAEYVDNVLVYCGLPNRKTILKLKKDDGLDDDNDVRTHYLHN